jgi:hypothetical protein
VHLALAVRKVDDALPIAGHALDGAVRENHLLLAIKLHALQRPVREANFLM